MKTIGNGQQGVVQVVQDEMLQVGQQGQAFLNLGLLENKTRPSLGLGSCDI